MGERGLCGGRVERVVRREGREGRQRGREEGREGRKELELLLLSHFSFGFKVQMGRIQPVVMAPKNPFFHRLPPLLRFPPTFRQCVGLAGIRTHDAQLFNQSHLPHGHRKELELLLSHFYLF